MSALLCSRVHAANHPARLGADFQLAPNPRAAVPVPSELKLRGTVFEPYPSQEAIRIREISLEPVAERAGGLSCPEVSSFRDVLSDPEWMSDPQGKARREAARVINELRGRKKPD